MNSNVKKRIKHCNETIDVLIKNRSIIRLSNIINSTTKIKWKCNKCNYIWTTTPHHIINLKTGCPKCANNIKLNNDIIDERIKNRDLIRIGDFISCSKHIEWQCKICNKIWRATPNHIIHSNRGCPRCSGNERLTNEIADERIKHRDILRLENVKRCIDKILWKCLVCNNTWKAMPNNIFNYKGCPNCACGNNERLIRNFLIKNNIEFNNITIKLDCGNCFPDFYLPQFNTIIEYHGEQHYKPVNFGGGLEKANKKFIKQKNRDRQLRIYCKNNNINLIEINGTIYQNKKLINLIKILIRNGFVNPL